MKLSYLLLGISFLMVVAFGQTLIHAPSQVRNNQVGQYGIACGAGVACTWNPFVVMSATPPASGQCPSLGFMMATNEPALYFCAQSFPGAPTLNWVRFQGVSSW